MPTSEYDVDHNDFFGRDEPEYFADQPSMRERPNKKIEVRVRLNLSPDLSSVPPSVPAELKTELKNNNMALTPSNSRKDILIISGIPSDFGFGRQQVLDIVKAYAPKAEFA